MIIEHIRNKFFQNDANINGSRWKSMVKYIIHVHTVIGTRPNFPVPQNMVAKRGLTNRANVHTPMWKKSIKNTERQNSNRSSNFGCNWISFHQRKKKKTKNAGLRRRNWILFFFSLFWGEGALIQNYWLLWWYNVHVYINNCKLCIHTTQEETWRTCTRSPIYMFYVHNLHTSTSENVNLIYTIPCRIFAF